MIDLFIQKEDSYTIIDYKTSSSLKDEHKAQVGHYKKAIENIVKSKSVKGYIFYLLKDEIQIVEI